MKLADWRRSEGMTQQQLADALDCILTTVARYEAGQRIPEPENMRRLFVLSNGKVQPNDFYALPDLTTDALAA
jgi:transcriptional regulator with XRE-family HTH domain